jgi:catechol 2,3-dioxygenase-like lactoylglutathione lyase family enzyme
MGIKFTLTKIMVRDPAALESFYTALGFKVTERRFGEETTGLGDEQVTQEQLRMTETGDLTTHQLVLARFPYFPEPAGNPPYPGPFWLVLNTTDVDESVATVLREGGRVHIAAQDVSHQGAAVRAAVVCDPEGNFIELFKFTPA